MKNLMKSIKTNKWVKYMLLFEVVWLLIYGVVQWKRPATMYDFAGQDIFSYDAMEYVTLEQDGSYTITSNDWIPEADAWKIENLTLRGGQYRIRIYYTAQDLLFSNVDSRIKIEAFGVRNYFSDEILEIKNGAPYTEKNIWVDHKTERFSIVIHYGGWGELNISRICIEENMMARFGQWVQWLIGFLVLDYLLIVMFCEEVYTLYKRQRIFGLTCIVGLVSIPMITDTLFLGHDIGFHVARIDKIAEELTQGHFPVRIYDSAWNGYGYASPIFYGETLLYIPAILHVLGFPLFRAYQYYVIFINILTAGISYWCFTKMFSSKRIGMFGSALYTCSFYRIICIYTRSAVGEYTAMTFFPLIIYGMWLILLRKDGKEDIKGWIVLALGATGIIQCHMLSTEMVAVFCVLTCVICIKRMFRMETIVSLIKAVILTLLLNAWFWVPFVEYMQGNYHANPENINNLDKSGAYIGQILSLFPVACGDNIGNGMAKEMPLAIGASLALCMLLFIWYRIKNGKQESEEYFLGKKVALLGGVAIWLASIYCPWDSIRYINRSWAGFFSVIQFPWRYLAIATILLVIVGCCVLKLIGQTHGTQICRYISCALIIVTFGLGGAYFSDYMHTGITRQYIDFDEKQHWFDGLYLPAGADSSRFSEKRFLCDDGIVIDNIVIDNGEIEFFCENLGSTTLAVTVPKVYYPNYIARTESGKLSVEKGNYSQVAVCVPSGFSGEISVEYKSPIHWHIMEMLSLVTVFGVIIYMVWKYRKRYKM